MMSEKMDEFGKALSNIPRINIRNCFELHLHYAILRFRNRVSGLHNLRRDTGLGKVRNESWGSRVI
jgi:hypothetical protein